MFGGMDSSSVLKQTSGSTMQTCQCNNVITILVHYFVHISVFTRIYTHSHKRREKVRMSVQLNIYQDHIWHQPNPLLSPY